MSNSVDPDETAHYELSHLDLRCLQKPIIIACGSEMVKSIQTHYGNTNILPYNYNVGTTLLAYLFISFCRYCNKS